MAGDEMALAQRPQDRRLDAASRLRRGAAGMEAAARGRVVGARQLALQHDAALPMARIEHRIGRKKRR